MVVSDVGINYIQPRLLHILLQGWLEPPPIGSSPRFSSCRLMAHPAAEGPKVPYHLGR